MPADNEIVIDPFKVCGTENGQRVEIYERPKYDDEGKIVDVVKYIRVEKPGSNSTFDGPMTEKHIRNFPKCFQAFKNREKLDDEGTSLSMLPGFPEHLANEYHRRDIFSIEALAELDDLSLGNFPAGRKMHELAKKFLDLNNPEARARRDAELIEKAKAELAEDPDFLAKVAEANKPKRKTKPKGEEEAA